MGWLENRVRQLRFAATAIAVAGTLALTGCGGGGDGGAVVQGPAFQIGVVGTSTAYAPVDPGQVLEVDATVGQSIEFDASEPVVWSFSANGSPLFGNGTTVDVGGVTIQQDQFTPSKVVLGSVFYGPAVLPVEVILTATSTIDAAQVATIRLLLH